MNPEHKVLPTSPSIERTLGEALDVPSAVRSFQNEVDLQKDDLSLRSSEPARNQPIQSAAVAPTGSLLQIPIALQVILGTTRMALSKVLALGPGSVISLDQKLSEPVLLQVNGNEFARGTIVVIDEVTGQLGITLTDISASAASAKIND